MRKLSVAFVLMSSLSVAPARSDQKQDGSERVVVPTHDIQRGELISDADLAYVDMPTGRVLVSVVTSMNDLNGHEARRLLRAGETLRADDVRRPIIVAKGSAVSMTFEAPGIALTAVGRAMSEGGMGETVIVLNPVSYRQISGIVTGPGEVRAGDVTSVAPGELAAAQDVPRGGSVP
jgi:flagella basal body P-ring formation protein FlgA